MSHPSGIDIEKMEEMAEIGMPMTQLEIGVCYFHGRYGFEKDKSKLAIWYEKAVLLKHRQ